MIMESLKIYPVVKVIVLSELLKQLSYWHDGENAANGHTDRRTYVQTGIFAFVYVVDTKIDI